MRVSQRDAGAERQGDALNTSPTGGEVTEVIVGSRRPSPGVLAATSSSLAAGAANSAKILLSVGKRQASARPGQRLGQVGRNYMFHNSRRLGGPVRANEPDCLPKNAHVE